MIVYRPLPARGLEWVQPASTADFDRVYGILGQELRDSWVPPVMTFLREDDQGIELGRAEAPWLAGNALVFRSGSLDSARRVLGSSGEFLPLAVDGSQDVELWAFNALRVIDALDYDRARVVRFTSGRIMTVDSFAFKEDQVADEIAFRVPQLREVFVTDLGVDALLQYEIAGLRFEPVWRAGT